MENVSITVPYQPAALRAAADMLFNMARDLGGIIEEVPEYVPTPVPEPTPEPASEPTPAPELDPTPEVFKNPEPIEAPAAPAEHGVELDVQGIPWDFRIHASSKTKNMDGTWRVKRGTPPETVATITDELKAAQGAPAAIVPPPPPVSAPIAPPPPAAAADVPPPPPPSAGPLSFPDMLRKIGAAKLSKDVCNASAKKFGLPSFALVATRPDLIPQIAIDLGLI